MMTTPLIDVRHANKRPTTLYHQHSNRRLISPVGLACSLW